MNAFQKMVEDVFNIKQFIEYFEYENQNIKCISYSIQHQPQIIAYGLDQGVNFYITCKVSDFTPAKNKHIKFRGKTYKIDKYFLDPHALSWKILLKTSYKQQE